MNEIRIRGARTHNLKNIDVNLPRDRLIVITGLSGSGKSSLAFDTIYAEGQRRYVESLSAYARQFLSMMEKPDVDSIEGLSPAIAIEQKSTSQNPRSTVGTITEIYDYLRLLYARVGTPRCPEHGADLSAQTVQQMVDSTLAMDANKRFMLLAPVVKDRKGEHASVFEQLRAQGYVRARVNGEVLDLDTTPKLALRSKHTIEAVIDRFKPKAELKQRLSESYETALRLGDGVAKLVDMDDQSAPEVLYSSKFSCPHCDYSLTEMEPRLFSFNSPMGACQACDGLGVTQYFDPARIVTDRHASLAGGAIRGWDKRNAYYFALVRALAKAYKFDVDTAYENLSEAQQQVILFGTGKDEIEVDYVSENTGAVTRRKMKFEGIVHNFERRYKDTDSNLIREDLSRFISQRACPECVGARLNKQARNVYVGANNIANVCALSISDCQDFFAKLRLQGWRAEIASKILKEIRERLRFLIDVGLDYLMLERTAGTLSGGEAQRIRLASQIGAGLVGVMYVLDEPSIGLHQRDNERLLRSLIRLRDLGNTVIVVEHDEDAIRAADYVLDIGPGAGKHGGCIVAQGTPKELLRSNSLTAQYLSGKREIALPATRRPAKTDQWLHIKGATGNNLKNVDLALPAGLFTCITGVSGSGKSTLINDTLMALASRELNGSSERPAAHVSHSGMQLFDKCVSIDQGPIGRTPRSNPATYTGLFSPIRDLYASVPEARARGYEVGRFSFNVKGGRCEACQGDGLIKVEMHFLPDVYVPCDVCVGKRYNRETLEITYKGKNISEVLAMTVEEAFKLFEPVPFIARKLKTLLDVGLSYITLGQSATTLSGGEAQRVKLATELSRRDTGRTIYILDEPTTGLHFHDIDQLLKVLQELVGRGNTVVVIEHNLDVIKTADWCIDLGPEGGFRGGEIIAQGTPEQIAQSPKSYTGGFLAKLLPKTSVKSALNSQKAKTTKKTVEATPNIAKPSAAKRGIAKPEIAKKRKAAKA
jgi:excinuclease ABC subunit A